MYYNKDYLINRLEIALRNPTVIISDFKQTHNEEVVYNSGVDWKISGMYECGCNNTTEWVIAVWMSIL